VLQLERLDRIGGTAADDVQLALEGIGDETSGPRPTKIWRITGSLALTVGDIGISVDRHITPAEDDLAFGLTERSISSTQACREAPPAAGTPCRRRTRQVAAVHALLGHFLAIELVRNLDQDTGTITLQRIGADGTR
jgi:hypothetical protein